MYCCIQFVYIYLLAKPTQTLLIHSGSLNFARFVNVVFSELITIWLILNVS